MGTRLTLTANDQSLSLGIPMPIAATRILGEKSGLLIPGDFSGDPVKATIVFANPFPDANYSITLGIGSTGYAYVPTWESKTAAGFDVNLNSKNLSGLSEVGWQATRIGD